MTMDDEKRRLLSLKLYKILDTATEKTYDNLTRLAANICAAPISLVSLVDDHRQWFKSRYGLEETETPREQAFCAHAIQDDQLMIVEDALNDQRFAENPLVTGQPHIRFYAGAPLSMADGHRIGTLCVIDRVQRSLTSSQREALSTLRDAVVAQIELRRATQDLKDMTKLLPVCAWCHSVKVENNRDGSELWFSLHDYVCKTTPATHGICPKCAETIKVKHERVVENSK